MEATYEELGIWLLYYAGMPSRFRRAAGDENWIRKRPARIRNQLHSLTLQRPNASGNRLCGRGVKVVLRSSWRPLG